VASYVNEENIAMSEGPRGKNKIANALKLLDKAAAARNAELASLLSDGYAALKAAIVASGNVAAHAFEQGNARATETAREADDPSVDRVVEVYEHVHRN
jgi:hypothetical protein